MMAKTKIESNVSRSLTTPKKIQNKLLHVPVGIISRSITNFTTSQHPSRPWLAPTTATIGTSRRHAHSSSSIEFLPSTILILFSVFPEKETKGANYCDNGQGHHDSIGSESHGSIHKLCFVGQGKSFHPFDSLAKEFPSTCPLIHFILTACLVCRPIFRTKVLVYCILVPAIFSCPTARASLCAWPLCLPLIFCCRSGLALSLRLLSLEPNIHRIVHFKQPQCKFSPNFDSITRFIAQSFTTTKVTVVVRTNKVLAALLASKEMRNIIPKRIGRIHRSNSVDVVSFLLF